jgi:micrococcal nuclease
MMRHSRWTPVLLAGLALAALPAAARPQAAEAPTTCKVVYVLDGDTINCEGGVTVRLLLVDVPDRGDLGEQARAYVVGLAPKDSQVRLEYDEYPRDGEGRWLAYVYLRDGTMLNKRLVESGFAYVEFSAKNRARLHELREAEQAARHERLGIWSQ